jgi:hypothetical protein
MNESRRVNQSVRPELVEGSAGFDKLSPNGHVCAGRSKNV